MGSTRVYEVPEISCDHCKHSIESTLGAREDVDTAEVDVTARTVTVTGAADVADVTASLEGIGYDVAGTR